MWIFCSVCVFMWIDLWTEKKTQNQHNGIGMLCVCVLFSFCPLLPSIVTTAFNSIWRSQQQKRIQSSVKHTHKKEGKIQLSKLVRITFGLCWKWWMEFCFFFPSSIYCISSMFCLFCFVWLTVCYIVHVLQNNNKNSLFISYVNERHVSVKMWMTFIVHQKIIISTIVSPVSIRTEMFELTAIHFWNDD